MTTHWAWSSRRKCRRETSRLRSSLFLPSMLRTTSRCQSIAMRSTSIANCRTSRVWTSSLFFSRSNEPVAHPPGASSLAFSTKSQRSAASGSSGSGIRDGGAIVGGNFGASAFAGGSSDGGVGADLWHPVNVTNRSAQIRSPSEGSREGPSLALRVRIES